MIERNHFIQRPKGPVSLISDYARLVKDPFWEDQFKHSQIYKSHDALGSLDIAISPKFESSTILAGLQNSVHLYGMNSLRQNELLHLRGLKQMGTPPINCAKFRSDIESEQQLICVATSDGYVRVFRSATGTCLRLFGQNKTKSRSTFKSCLFALTTNHVIAGNDLGEVIKFNLTEDKDRGRVFSTKHDDIVQSLNLSSDFSRLITGSLDRSVMIIDLKSDQVIDRLYSNDPVMSVFSSQNYILAGSGCGVDVWDCRNTSTKLARLTAHHKTVMSVQTDELAQTAFAGGLDGHVKIYNLKTLECPVLHSLAFKSPIASMRYQSGLLAVGCVDGRISLRYNIAKLKGASSLANTRTPKTHEPIRNPLYFILFKRHCLAESLDLALEQYSRSNTNAEDVVALMREMWKHGLLKRALAGRCDLASLGPLANFISNHCHSPRYADVLLDVGLCLVDTLMNLSKDDVLALSNCENKDERLGVEEMLARLAKNVECELEIGKEANKLARTCDKILYGQKEGL
ncbi:hypothetical protein ACOME3_001949 [Neoechinorhynchus agilis]